MKPLLALPLILAACACPPLTRGAMQDCQRRAAAGLVRLEDCLCERPTGALLDTLRERGDRMPDAIRPEPPKVEPPKPGPDPEPPRDREPDRKTDPNGWRDWRDRNPRGGA